ncbi:hypothetical protein TCAL_14328 [Tigriopus californicus]|uniref:Uncharacterized protein n=1 Tax=Tigriopus californicus TaxID=6832 RepID=A0A553NEL2_TIGCA|nr:uncharacterized protein LOC131889164 [Tigriopus californicus]TRY63886.1 hypothetical protein TCAL_14328 [Tigriopus californicus]
MVKCFLILTCLCVCACVSQAFPQPDDTANVIEVEDPEAKRHIFEAFKTNEGQRSILYDSFLPAPPRSDRIGGDFEIVVESVELVLTKPQNPDQKLKEKAEARRANA